MDIEVLSLKVTERTHYRLPGANTATQEIHPYDYQNELLSAVAPTVHTTSTYRVRTKTAPFSVGAWKRLLYDFESLRA